MNHLLVDYLTISFKFSSEFKAHMLQDKEEQEKIRIAPVFSEYFKKWMFEELHLPEDKMLPIKSRYGYASCWYYDGITVHIDDGILLLDMSGKGCRTCEDLNKNFDWYEFIHQFHDLILYLDPSGDPPPVHIARMDIAFDDLGNKTVTVPLLQRYVRAKKYVSRVTYVSCVDGTHEQAIYFGSPKSDRRLRIYDKRMEQLGTDSDIPWVRYEFQLRNENALSFYLNLCRLSGNWSECYFGVLSDFVTFLNRSRLEVGHHSERLEPVKWWTDLVGYVLKLKQLYLPGRDYTLRNMENYWVRNCLSTAKAMLLVDLQKNNNDATGFIEKILEAELNDKQSAAVDKELIRYPEVQEVREQERLRSIELRKSLKIYKENKEMDGYECPRSDFEIL